MLRAIAAAKKKNDKIDASKIDDCLRCDFLPECHMASMDIEDRRRTLRYRTCRLGGQYTAREMQVLRLRYESRPVGTKNLKARSLKQM